MAPREKNFLPELFNRLGALPARQATEGERIESGRIYVAPPDRHLQVAENHIHLTRGPKEGLHRPSINVTFRSAAMTYGPRVIGVLLSGMLDDGAAGLWEIANRRGITIVQDPSEAKFPSMPLNALQDCVVDYKPAAAEIGTLLPRLVSGEEVSERQKSMSHDVQYDRFSGFTCPECHGPLYEKTTPGPIEFRCRVGHVLTLKTLFDEQSSVQERKLYEAILALEEGAELALLTATRVNEAQQQNLKREAEHLRRQAGTVRQLLEHREMPSID